MAENEAIADRTASGPTGTDSGESNKGEGEGEASAPPLTPFRS